MSYSFEYIDIILLAMIAGFIFLRLRGILGKRSGFEGKATTQFDKILKETVAKKTTKMSQIFDESAKKEFIKDSFCRFERKYCAGDYNDISAYAYFKKDKIVFDEYNETYEKKGILKCAEYSTKPLNY